MKAMASFWWYTAAVLDRFFPPLYNALGIFLPLITVNCTVLFISLKVTTVDNLSYIQAVVYSISAAIGFWLAMIMVAAIPLPYIAIEAGWVLAEVGRQPWIVYGLMKTSDAVSPIAGSQVLFSLIGFIVVYSLLGAIGFYLITINAKKGPVLEA